MKRSLFVLVGLLCGCDADYRGGLGGRPLSVPSGSLPTDGSRGGEGGVALGAGGGPNGAGGAGNAGPGPVAGRGGSGGSGGSVSVGTGGTSTGNGGAGSAGAGGGSTVANATPCTGTDNTLRMLNRSEMNGSFKFLLGDDTNKANAFAETAEHETFFTTNRESQHLDNAKVSDLEQAVVSALVDGVWARELALATAQRLVLTCDASMVACQRTILGTVGRRAWRRALTTAEIDGLVSLAAATDSGRTSAAGLKWAVKALLLSPEFLFVVESGSPTAAIDPTTLATRMSLFLVGRVPDDELLTAAADGRLATAAGYGAQVQRLMATPLAAEHWATNVAGNWLGVNAAVAPRLTGAQFAGYEAARPSMEEETKRFVRNLYDADAPTRDVLVADYSFINQSLGRFYGVDAGTAFTKTRLPSERSGILTQPLMMSSTVGVKNPIYRGVWVFRRLMCKSLKLPADLTIPPIPETASSQSLSVRTRLEQHTSNDRCRSCHSLIDPVGLTLEEMDDATNFRTAYTDGKPVESQVTLVTGRSVKGPRQLAAAIDADGEFDLCAVRQMNAYAFGVGHSHLKFDAIEAQVTAWKTAGGGTRALVASVANAPEFKQVCGTRD